MIKDKLLDFLNRRKAVKQQELQLTEEETRKFAGFAHDKSMWDNLLKFVRSDEITDSQLEELIAAISRKDTASVVKKVKQELECECDYSSEIRKLHPKVSANELLICCHIVQGKSSKEIAQLMNVGVSTITSYRCRLRTKLKVKEGTSLKVYLDSITRLKLKRSRSVMNKLNK